MLVKEVLFKSTEFLKGKGIESGRLDSELLLSTALGLKRIDLYLRHEQPLSESEVQKCREFIARRGKGEPVAYILKTKGFFGLDFYVDQRVLIPRPETELLVERVLEVVKKTPTWEGGLTLVDLGSGSGAIGVALLANLPSAKAHFIDIDAGALAVTKQNLEAHDLLGRAQLIHSDVATAQPEQKFDIVVGNPPYIAINDPEVQDSVKQFEPHLALFSGDDGLVALKSWADWTVKYLKPNGFFMFEMGITQGPAALDIFNSLGEFSNVRIINDLTGRPRFVEGMKNG